MPDDTNPAIPAQSSTPEPTAPLNHGKVLMPVTPGFQASIEQPPTSVFPTQTTAGQPPLQPITPNLNIDYPAPQIQSTPFAGQPIANPTQSQLVPPLNPTVLNMPSSAFTQPKPRLPFGIYLIAAYAAFSLVVSFFNTTENGTIFSIDLILSLLIAIGLLLRLNVVRKIAVVYAGISAVVFIIIIVLLSSVVHKFDKAQAEFNSGVSGLEQHRLSTADQQKINQAVDTLTQEKKQLDKIILRSYVSYSIALAVQGATIVYLTRPKVKDVFVEIEK